MKKKIDPYYPCILATVPRTVLTREETYRRVPRMRVFHVPAINPHPEYMDPITPENTPEAFPKRKKGRR